MREGRRNEKEKEKEGEKKKERTGQTKANRHWEKSAFVRNPRVSWFEERTPEVN